MATSTTAAIEPMLGTTLRVLRNITTLEDLVAAWPSLKEKADLAPLALTDEERRLILDLPDRDVELSNISATTNISREDLIEKANSDQDNLTSKELALLKNRFWTQKTGNEASLTFSAMGRIGREALHDLLALRDSIALPEQTAFRAAARESRRRERGAKSESLRAADSLDSLDTPDVKEWRKALNRRETYSWGFVCLYDARAQQLPAAHLERFEYNLHAFLAEALKYSRSCDLISKYWTLLCLNAPEDAFAPVTIPDYEEDSEEDVWIDPIDEAEEAVESGAEEVDESEVEESEEEDEDSRDWGEEVQQGEESPEIESPGKLGETREAEDTEYQGGAILRDAFQRFLADPAQYQETNDVRPSLWKYAPTGHFKNGITGFGLLTNTFLVIDKVCIAQFDDVGNGVGPWYDDLRVLAFEAHFPVQGRTYVEGYQGFVWVRLDQLVYNFYELRSYRSNETTMDQIWKTAQESPHKAFVSMDPREAEPTESSARKGFTRDSVLGREWYAAIDVKR